MRHLLWVAGPCATTRRGGRTRHKLVTQALAANEVKHRGEGEGGEGGEGGKRECVGVVGRVGISSQVVL